MRVELPSLPSACSAMTDASEKGAGGAKKKKEEEEEEGARPVAALCGLSNPLGQQHCFLNVCVHALWSSSEFRKRVCAECCACKDEGVTRVARQEKQEEEEKEEESGDETGDDETKEETTLSAEEEKEEEEGGVNKPKQITLALGKLFRDRGEGKDEQRGDPLALRVALADEYSDLGRFRLEKTDDASEALGALLRCIHNE